MLRKTLLTILGALILYMGYQKFFPRVNIPQAEPVAAMHSPDDSEGVDALEEESRPVAFAAPRTIVHNSIPMPVNTEEAEVLPEETTEQLLEPKEIPKNIVPAGSKDLRYTEAELMDSLSTDERIQKVADIISVICQAELCEVKAQAKPNEDDNMENYFMMHLKAHPQFGAEFKAAPQKDAEHGMTFSYPHQTDH